MINKYKSKFKLKFSGLHMSLVSIILIPVIILGLCVSAFVYKRFTGITYEEVEVELCNTALILNYAYENAYPGDYDMVGTSQVAIVKGEKVLNGDFDILDSVKKDTGCEVTLFYDNVRVLTTICDEKGERIVGTTARRLVYNQVKEKEKGCFYSNSLIGNVKYFSYYMPVFNSDGQYCGMIAVAKSASEINEAILKGVAPILIIVFAAIILMALLNYRYTNELIRRIKKIRRFLKKTEEEDFESVIDDKELQKNDEISEMAKSAISMQKALRKLVEQDALTEINNRRYGNKALVETRKEYMERGVQYCVAIADIDYFKKVNDTYGHEAGDRVLVEIASILRSGMLGKGFVARWGGEEFLLVFEGIDIDTSYAELCSIFDKIRNKEIFYDNKMIKVTMTGGITEGTDEPVHTIINKADEMLYEGKQSGRNKIIR